MLIHLIIASFHEVWIFIYFSLIHFYGCIYGIWKFLCQGLIPSHSCNLHHSCSNTGFFNPLSWAREQTHASAATQNTAVRFLTLCTKAGTPMTFLNLGVVTKMALIKGGDSQTSSNTQRKLDLSILYKRSQTA